MRWRGPCTIGPILSVSAPSTTPPSDDTLMGCVVDRDHHAFSELYRRHRRVMHAVAARLAHDTAVAEDAVQDACLQVWKNARQYDPARGSVLSWLLVIVRARTLDRLRAMQLRARWSRSGVDPDTAASPYIPMEYAWELRDAMRQVTAALDVLPGADRRSIELAYHEGLTHAEIAQRLKLPLGTVKTQLRRGVQVLRTAIDGLPRRPFDFPGTQQIEGPPSQALQQRRVLVVDDEPDTVRLTALVLERAGADVVSATSGRQALERLDSARPDLILLDLEMPEMDGYALMGYVSGWRQRVNRKPPVVAFTAQTGVEQRIEAAGFDLCITKPVLPGRLVAVSAGLLAR